MVVAIAAPVTPSLGKEAQAKDQTWTQDNIYQVREPEHAHCYRGVARAAEDCVDTKEQQDDGVPTEHDARVARTKGNDARGCSHQAQ